MTSVVALDSTRVGVFCGSRDIATTPNGLFDLSGVTTFSKYFARAQIGRASCRERVYLFV